MKSTSHRKVQEIMIVHTLNRVKQKIRGNSRADVFFNPADLAMAQSILEETSKRGAESEMSRLISTIISLWDKVLKNDQEQCHTCTMIKIYMNRVKELSLLSSLKPMEKFVSDLLLFLEQANIALKSHRVIITAYIDVIQLCHKNRIHDYESAEAQLLKEEIDKAIQRNL